MGFPPLSEKQEMNSHASEEHRQIAWSTEQEQRRWNGSHTTPPEHPPGNGGTHFNFNPGQDQHRSSGAAGLRSTEKQEWTYLRYALQQQFQSHRSNFEREYELRERKQKPGEIIEVYIQTMLALRSRLEMPFSDFDLIKVIKMNIRDQISRIIYPIYFKNLDQPT